MYIKRGDMCLELFIRTVVNIIYLYIMYMYRALFLLYPRFDKSMYVHGVVYDNVICIHKELFIYMLFCIHIGFLLKNIVHFFYSVYSAA